MKWPGCSARVPFRIKKDPGSREANKSKGRKLKRERERERKRKITMEPGNREKGREGKQIKSKSRGGGNCFIINNVQALHCLPLLSLLSLLLPFVCSIQGERSASLSLSYSLDRPPSFLSKHPIWHEFFLGRASQKGLSRVGRMELESSVFCQLAVCR